MRLCVLKTNYPPNINKGVLSTNFAYPADALTPERLQTKVASDANCGNVATDIKSERFFNLCAIS